MPHLPTRPTTTSAPKIDPSECGLCINVAWKGPKCPGCSSYKKQHYAEGTGPKGAAFFCVAESPFLSNISGQLDNHESWHIDLEKVVRDFFKERKSLNNHLARLESRFTYAVRCQVEKPSGKEIKCCSELFIPELLEHAPPGTPMMIFALGPAVAKALGLKFRKYAAIQGQFITVKIRGKDALVFPSLSKRQMVAKTGYIEILKQHIQVFLDGVLDLQMGRAVQTKLSLGELTKNYVFPKTLADVEKIIDEILNYAEPGKNPENNILALDTETNTKFPHRKKLKLLSVNIAWAPGKATAILVDHPAAPWTPEEIQPYLARLFQSPQPKVFHNGQFDLKVLHKKGYRVRKFSWDTMAGEHLLAEDKRGFYGLKVLTRMMAPQYAGYEEQVKDVINKSEAGSLSKQLKAEAGKNKEPKLKGAAKKMAEDTETDGFANVPVDDLLVYGAIDSDVTRIICGKQRERMFLENKRYRKTQESVSQSPKFVEHGRARTTIPEPLSHLMFHHVVPSIRILADMEDYGFAVDRPYLDTLAQQMDKSIISSKTKLMMMIPPYTLSQGEEFNPNSTVHLRKILFGSGYLHPETKRPTSYAGRITPVLTKTGQQTTNKAFLRSLATQMDCPFSKELLQYRAMAKARNTFVENIRILSEEDGRMHTSFHITGTGTGRLCVSENTILDTDMGSFVISQLDLTKVPNIRIITHKGRWRKIKKVFYKGREEMYCVELENGDKIEVTHNHRFFTPDGLHHLRELDEGSAVYVGRYCPNGVSCSTLHNTANRRPITTSCAPDSFGTCRIKKITPIGIKGVWDIEVEEDHSYISQGFVNHNSSSDENMQNIPPMIGKHNIKKIFIPTDSDTQVLCNADAKAAEVRVYAAYSRDKNLIQALADGLDPHSYFSSVGYKPETVLTGVEPEFHKATLELIGIDDVHAWTYEEFEKAEFYQGTDEIPGPDPAYGRRLEKLRKNMKRVVFGILYGAGKRKVAEIVGISLEQAQTIIDILFRMFPTIPQYIKLTQEQIDYFGMIETFFGRRRRLNLRSLTKSLKASAYRKGVNFNIQSTSSDIVMSVLCDIDQAIRDLGGRMLITVHDSLVFEVEKKYVTQLPDLIEEYGVKRVAQRYPWLPVPFKWDVKVGPSYGETMSISKYLETNAQHVTPEVDQDSYIEQDIRSEFEELSR